MAASEATSLTHMATSTCTPHSSTGFQFMKLPTEIRLFIYRALLVLDDSHELFGTHEFSLCQCGCPKECHHLWELFVHPSILRICKAIHREALPILYSDNRFSLLCYSWEEGKEDFWYRFMKKSRLRSPNPYVSTSIKHGSLTYGRIFYDTVDILLFTLSWQDIEQEILELYPNLESILLRIHQDHDQSICLKLVRRHRSKRGMRDRVQDSTVILDDLALRVNLNEKAWYSDIPLILRDLCDAIQQNESQEQMAKPTFAVQAIRWGSYLGGPHPSWEKFDRLEIYMGCEQEVMGSVVNVDGGMEANQGKG